MGHSKNPSKKIECFQQEFAKEEQGPEIQTNKIPQPESVGNEPPFDYSDEDKPYKIRVFPCKMNFSDDSSTDDSDSEESIGEEEYREKQLEFPPKAAPQEDQTSIEPIEERLDLDFVPDSKTQAIQLAKSSTTELLSGPTIPTSSILVKHGTKRPAEAEVGDEDSKRAKKMTKLMDLQGIPDERLLHLF